MFRNWLTSLAGIGAGALNLYTNGTHWQQVVFSFAIAALGSLAQDFNKPSPPAPK